MSRCIDDHPDAICLCETEINRTLFSPYILAHHLRRMARHGFGLEQAIELLDRRPQNSVDAWYGWYADILPLVSDRYRKPRPRAVGDKSPDFFTAPALVEAIATSEKLIYTVRDPRSILRSIWSEREDSSEAEKEERWGFLKSNIRCWTPHLDRPNLLAVRYEDLVRDPLPVLTRVYAHLGLPPSRRFLDPFERADHKRFLWDTAVDWATGVARDFDSSRIEVSDEDLGSGHLTRIHEDPEIAEFMERFGYRPKP